MILVNKKISIKPIVKNKGLFEKGHDGEFMYTGTFWSTDLGRDKYTNRYKQVLSKEEQTELEKELQLKEGALNTNNKDSEFWSKYRVKLTKEGKILDLSKAWDYLEYKVLQTSNFIAPSWSEINQSGEYKFALVDEDIVMEEKLTKSKLKQKAYKHFGKIEESVQDMQMIIRLVTGKRTNSVKLDFLQAEIDKLVESKTEEFVKVIEDPNYKTKVLIEKCIDKNILDKNHLGEYRLKGGIDPVAQGIEEMVNFLLSPKNGDILLKLKSQLDK